MADVFHEVDEQLRSARFQSGVRRGWPYAVGLVVIVAVLALIAWGLNQRELAQSATASVGYADAMQALQTGDLVGADTRFAKVAASGPKSYRALALMQEAGVRLRQNDGRAALALLDQAAQAAPNAIVEDAARLQGAYIVMDAGDYAQTRSRLLPLAATGRPYRLMAREALGLAELATGRIAQARGDLQIVSLSSDASDIAHTRAGAALALIQSGDWSSLTPIAKASASLAPQTPPPPSVSPVPAAAAQATSQAAPQTGATP